MRIQYGRLYLWRCATGSNRPNRKQMWDRMDGWFRSHRRAKSWKWEWERRGWEWIRLLRLPSPFLPTFSTKEDHGACYCSPLKTSAVSRVYQLSYFIISDLASRSFFLYLIIIKIKIIFIAIFLYTFWILFIFFWVNFWILFIASSLVVINHHNFT